MGGGIAQKSALDTYRTQKTEFKRELFFHYTRERSPSFEETAGTPRTRIYRSRYKVTDMDVEPTWELRALNCWNVKDLILLQWKSPSPRH